MDADVFMFLQNTVRDILFIRISLDRKRTEVTNVHKELSSLAQKSKIYFEGKHATIFSR